MYNDIQQARKEAAAKHTSRNKLFMKEFLRRNLNFLKLIKELIPFAGEGCPLVFNFRSYSANNFLRRIIKFIVTPFYILKYFFHGKISDNDSNRSGLAIVLIAKNEAPYILEWINFHVKQGVSHFLIYDNESTDNLLEVLQPFIASGLVTYNKIPGKIRQTDAYNHAVYNYKKKFKYFAIIDADEFLFTPDNAEPGALYKFVDDFMNKHKNAGGIGANWLVFGSSGHETKPAGGVLENYTRCAEKDFGAHHLIKTICDPLKVFACSVHFCVYYGGFYTLSENGEIVNRAESQTINFDKIRINHYFMKSKQEFVQKIMRGMADNKVIRNIQDFYCMDRNEALDTEILSHI